MTVTPPAPPATGDQSVEGSDTLHFHCLTRASHSRLLSTHAGDLLSLSASHRVRVLAPGEDSAVDAGAGDAAVAGLNGAPALDGAVLQAYLETHALAHTLVVARAPRSTQDVARAARATHAWAVAAGAQTRGRGRRGAAWECPPGALALTVCVGVPACAAERLTFVQYVGALALATAARAGSWGVEARVKWPNDVLVGGAKLGGVLCEATASAHGFDVCVGVGVNVWNAAPGACLLARDAAPGARKHARERFAAAFLNAFERDFDALVARGFDESLRTRYTQLWLHSGQRVSLAPAGAPAVVEGLAPDGRVRVRRLDLDALQDLRPEETSLDFAAGVLREKEVGDRLPGRA